MKRDPWNANMPGYPKCRYCAANDRMEKVRASCDLAWLSDVVQCADTQTTVRVAAERKIARLTKLPPKSKGGLASILSLALFAAFAASFSHARPGDAWERVEIQRVASEYRLTPAQAQLLHLIRRVENGGPGLEFGVGQHYANHPARRFANNRERSFLVQARWTAGSIKTRYQGPHDLKKFATRWNENPEQWAATVGRMLCKAGRDARAPRENGAQGTARPTNGGKGTRS